MPLPLIVSVPAAGMCVYGLLQVVNWEKREIKKTFSDCIKNANIKVGDTEHPKVPILTDIKLIKEPYGFEACITVPRGMDPDVIENLKAPLEWAYHGEVVMEMDQFEKGVKIKVALQPFENRDFAPVKTAPHEVFMGYTRFGKAIIIDMNSFPDVLIVGSIGSGKSRLLYIMLTNLITQFGCEDVQIYLTQLEKNDLYVFSKAKNVQYMAEDLMHARKMFEYLVKEMQHRNAVFKRNLDFGVFNIADYNKHYPKKKLPYIYIGGDEFSYYMPNQTDSDEVKRLKGDCLVLLESLIKAGRSAGIFVVLGLQRPDNKNMPTFIRSQMNCRVSFRTNSKRNAMLLMDDDDSVGLPVGECIVETNEKWYIKTPNIDYKIMRMFLEPYIDKRKEYRNIDAPIKEIISGPMIAQFIPGDSIQKNMGVVDYVM